MHRPIRRPALLFLVLALVVVAVPASANHTFGDVAATSAHHDAIARLDGTGITSGCAPGRFCPNAAVTRGQFATFLTRGGSHAVADHSTTTLTAGSGNVNGVAVTVALDGPGATGGRQQVVLQGSVTVYRASPVADCPCEVQAFVYRARDNAAGPSSWAVLGDETAADGSVSVAVPVTWAAAMDGPRREEYRLAVFVDGTTAGGFRADGSLTAVTAPFGEVPRG